MHGKLAGREKERYVEGLFGSIAPKYDLMNSIISLGKHKGWRRLAVRMAELKPGAMAIDVATGTGDFALELASAVGDAGLVVGTDFCRSMIGLAAEKSASKKTIELVIANAENLPFASNTFDCATIGFALRNVADVPATIKEITRVIKPGGRVISLEIVGPHLRILQPLWKLYFFRIMPRLATLFGAECEPYNYLPDSVARFYSREELADIFMDCGLVDVKIRNLTFGTVCIHMGTKL